MKTIKYKSQLEIVLHLLFWIVSFNIFNSFFSRGIDSGYTIDGLELSWWNMLFISNIIILILLLPFIWLFRGIKPKIKWGVTGLALTMIGLGAFLSFFTDDNYFIVLLILGYFLSNILYVLIFHITFIAAVYLNITLLVKRYLLQGRFVIYMIYAICLAVVAGLINYALFDWCIDLVFPKLFFISWFKVWELVLMIIGYMAITTVANLMWQYWLMLIANREKVQNELSALKAQINPHFLFNNLNTIYALASKGDQRTKDIILQLSDFLRYVLYDTTSEKIELEKEVEIIKTYIGLQKERINQDVTEIVLHIEGNFKGASIAPLLLLPLAENCFKHGLGKNKGTIQIDISYAARELHFCTKNPVAIREDILNNNHGGLGINNLEKRLNLLYPERHLLTFTEENSLFFVELKIDLD